MGASKYGSLILWKPRAWVVKRIHLWQNKTLDLWIHLKGMVGRTAEERGSWMQWLAADFAGGRWVCMVTYGICPHVVMLPGCKYPFVSSLGPIDILRQVTCWACLSSARWASTVESSTTWCSSLFASKQPLLKVYVIEVCIKPLYSLIIWLSDSLFGGQQNTPGIMCPLVCLRHW